jgi:hypothetical protein
MKSLRINIGKITLPGYSAVGQRQFTASLKSQLSELRKTPAVSDLNVQRLDAGQLRHSATPQDAANQIAKRLAAKLKGSRNV